MWDKWIGFRGSSILGERKFFYITFHKVWPQRSFPLHIILSSSWPAWTQSEHYLGLVLIVYFIWMSSLYWLILKIELLLFDRLGITITSTLSYSEINMDFWISHTLTCATQNDPTHCLLEDASPGRARAGGYHGFLSSHQHDEIYGEQRAWRQNHLPQPAQSLVFGGSENQQ